MSCKHRVSWYNVPPKTCFAMSEVQLTREVPLKGKRVEGNAEKHESRNPDGFFPARRNRWRRMKKNRKERDSAERQSTCEYDLSSLENQTKIWIIGSSYIRRGERAAFNKFGSNFGLNAKVEWFGKGEMGWSGVLPRFYAELSRQSPPDILVVHAGGNNLGLVSAQELASAMKKDLMHLYTKFPSMAIAFSCINERQVWRYGHPQWISNDRKIVNSTMRKAVDFFRGVIIEHPHLRFFDNTSFVDAVYFTKKGIELFLMSIHNASKKILEKSSQ